MSPVSLSGPAPVVAAPSGLHVTAEQAPSFGILKVDEHGRIVHFEEKPKPERLPHLVSEVPGVGRTYLASMGIYLFSRRALENARADRQQDGGVTALPQHRDVDR